MPDLRWLFKEPRLEGIESGSLEYLRLQEEIMRSRPLLRANYDLWYSKMLKDESTVPKNRQGKILEIGSGGNYVKTLRPDVITSDVVSGASDMAIDARLIPFPDRSLRAILMPHSFHHIPDVRAFLKEASRTLVPEGVISMIEPSATPMARIFFKYFHQEPFLARAKEWTFDSTNSMDSSNQALSWIVLKRDRRKFETLFPNLRVEHFGYLPWFSYVASGGVTRKNLVPSFATPLVKAMDVLTAPFHPIAALNWHITLRQSA